MDSFSNSLTGLLSSLRESYTPSFSGTTPYWVECLDKFRGLLAKLDNDSTLFTDCVEAFYNQHRLSLIAPILEGDEVNDDWLKLDCPLPLPWETSALTGPTKTKKKGKTGWSASTACDGIVVYYDTTSKKRAASLEVCIPLTEGYVSACNKFSEMSKKKAKCHLPAAILYYTYALSYHVCKSEAEKLMLQDNAEQMKAVMEAIKPVGKSALHSAASNVTSSGSSPMDMISNMFSGLGKDGFDIGKLVSNIIPLDKQAEIGEAFKQTATSVQAEMGDKPDLSKIGSIVQDKVLGGPLGELFSKLIPGILPSGSGSFSTVASAEDVATAAAQE